MLTAIKIQSCDDVDYAERTTSHITDSEYFGNGFSTHDVREIFSDKKRLQRWLDVEVALSESQAELGMIPETTAKELAKTARLEYLDTDYIKQQSKITKHSLVPLLRAWQKTMSKNNAQYVHFGATTQDIQDTAQVLELKDVMIIIEHDLKEVISSLTHLASKYRSLVMVGRTHAQHAMPITLGVKISTWLDECMRNYTRLQNCKSTLLVSQLFGGVGTMASFKDNGIQLLKLFSKKLGLHAPDTCWHSARDRFVEFTSTLVMITGTLGKIANEIIQLSKNEIGELSEPFHAGQIGSSTMPHKRNPEECERIYLLSKLVKQSASLGFETLITEHERDYRAIRLEWITLTDASAYTCCAFELIKPILKNLVVHEEKMTENVKKSADALTTESLRFEISQKINRDHAFNYVYQASQQSVLHKTALVDELLKIPEVAMHFNQSTLKDMLNPFHYIGSSVAITDSIVTKSILNFALPSTVRVSHQNDSTVIVTYTDPLEGFQGWLVLDGFHFPLSAGGMRVQKGLSSTMLVGMAKNMSKKMILCGLPVNGAKSGIDYDPSSISKRAAIARFMKAISPLMQSRYSMGSDLNTTMDELSYLAKEQGIASIKMAIIQKQNFTKVYFDQRENILNQKAIGNWSLGKIRAGYVVAMSAVKVAEALNSVKDETIINVQGFGVLAKATIVVLLDEGYKIHAISDVKKCVISKGKKGLPVHAWLDTHGGLLPELTCCAEYEVVDKTKLYDIHSDVLILAAIENAITNENAASISTKAIVPGANLAVTQDAEIILHKKGILVLPSYLPGSGGCMSMNGLFGPKEHPSPKQVLSYLKLKTTQLIDTVFSLSEKNSCSLTQAAEQFIQNITIAYRSNPYEV